MASAAFSRALRDMHANLSRLSAMEPRSVAEAAAMMDLVSACIMRHDDALAPTRSMVHGPIELGAIVDRVRDGLLKLSGDLPNRSRS